MNKGSRILISVAVGLIALIVLVLVGFRLVMRIPVASYYRASEKAFVIPGLDENFVPQGFHHDGENGYFLVSGYSAKSGAHSTVYVLNGESGEVVGKALLCKEDGEVFTGHSGGIARNGDYVYIAGGSGRCLYVYSYADILAAGNGGTVNRLGKFSLKYSDEDYQGTSFVSVVGDRLIVGEYRTETDYSYPDSHRVTTSAGDEHGGLAMEFALDPSGPYGISANPSRVYSIRDYVQGLWVEDGKIYLSTSHGLSHSLIYVYDEAKAVEEGTIKIIGRTLPLYSLDSASLTATYRIAPMSEELFVKDGKLYVMCESACSKYFFGNLIGGKWCYRTDLEQMKTE
ncbi:MAG: hypothetical protein IJW99_02235 [Clostridia bacterium]|nr:hypothetical protein [Clostridia bacterium]